MRSVTALAALLIGLSGEPASATSKTDYLKGGMMLDVGVPDGAALSGVFRPYTWLRVALGGTYNMISPGVRGGVTLLPFYFPVTPSLTLEAGHYFPGDASHVLSRFTNDSSVLSSPLLKKVSYSYANFHLGIETGIPRRFSIFLHFGLSYLQTSVHDFQTELQRQTNDPTLTAANPIIRLQGPSAKLGFLIYFL